jgi:hypothetical protein
MRKINYREEYPIVYAKNGNELAQLLIGMEKLGLVDHLSDIIFQLTYSGFVKAEELKQINITSMQCFIAISFGDTFDSIYLEGIEPAIKGTGFSPIYLKTKEHNNLIDDEIIGGIKRSRFLVAEISSENKNVYFEAGYAMGLKLPVILLCQKARKDIVHFDVSHYNTIFYSDNVDLKDRLVKRINACIL